MPRLSSALLIDPESKGLGTLTFGFVREGCKVMGATSYEEGIDKAQHEPHDVVVIALRDSPAECRELLENLAERNGAPVPIIGLGSEEHRTVVEAMPSSDFLPMPAFIRDILTAAKIRAAFDAGQADPAAGKPHPLISAPLSDFGVFSLIRSLQATQRSAIISLERGNHRGELRFSKGELTWAQVGSQQGVPALNQLLLWEEAAMEASFRQVVVKRSQFSTKGKALIEESERFLRDFVASAKMVGPANSVFEIVPERAEASKDDFAAEIAPVLRLFDGNRSLADVIDDSPFRVFDTLRVVNRFVDAGVLKANQEASKPSLARGVRSPLLEDWLKTPGDDEFVHSGVAEGVAKAIEEGRKVRKKKGKTQPVLPIVTRPAAAASASRIPAAAPPPVAPAHASATAPDTAERRSGTALPAARGELAAGRREEKRIAPRPSMVFDIPTEETAAPPAASLSDAPTTRGLRGDEGPAAAAAPAAAAPAPAVPAARPSGSIEARQHRPSDRPPPRPTGSIEISSDLLADMDKLETARPVPPPARAPTPAPVRRGLTPTPVRAGSAEGAKGRATPLPGKRRPSNEFDALETDFFAREADLYKRDAVDDFSDLDGPRRRDK